MHHAVRFGNDVIWPLFLSTFRNLWRDEPQYASKVETKNNTQPERGSRYEMETRLQRKRLPAPDKNQSGLHPRTGYLAGRWPKRTHRAGDLTLCRPLPAPKPTIEFLLLLLRRLAAARPACTPRRSLKRPRVAVPVPRPPPTLSQFPHATVASCSTPPGAMPLRTTGLQGLAEWHLVCLCRSSQRLIASSDPTLNQRTLSSGRLPITGCALHTERCHHTPRQEHRQAEGTSTAQQGQPLSLR